MAHQPYCQWLREHVAMVWRLTCDSGVETHIQKLFIEPMWQWCEPASAMLIYNWKSCLSQFNQNSSAYSSRITTACVFKLHNIFINNGTISSLHLNSSLKSSMYYIHPIPNELNTQSWLFTKDITCRLLMAMCWKPMYE